MPSKSPIPKKALALLAAALVSFAGAAGYTLYLNPEVRLYCFAAQIKGTWVTQLDQTPGPKYVFAGGSSCATTIRPQQLRDTYGLKAANLGLNAGMGADVLSRYALKQCRRGDVLILALEPSLLINPGNVTSLGKQFALATHNRDLLGARTIGDELSNWLALRPGAYHVVTLIGKLLSREPLYRYAAADFDASGWQNVTVRRAVSPPEMIPLPLSSRARALLPELRAICRDRGIGLFYSLPWSYTLPDQRKDRQRVKLEYLIEIAAFMPVLRDEAWGEWPIREDYADTFVHLTAAGAARRTDVVGHALRTNAICSRADLKSIRDSLR